MTGLKRHHFRRSWMDCSTLGETLEAVSDHLKALVGVVAGRKLPQPDARLRIP
jgi:hypothetical protein